MINNNKALEEESQQVPIPEQYIINKPLRLETVNQGSNEDDVLVRGNDNTVKYVSQSELGGNGIESVTGNVVDNSVFNNPIINLKTINNQNLSGSGNINITNSVPPIQQVLLAGSRVDDRGLEFHEASNRYTTYIASGGVTVVDHVENKGIGFEGGDQIFARNLALGGVNVLDLAINSGEIVFYNLANKPSGSYTLATRDDILLQTIVNSNGFAEKGEINTVDLLTPDGSGGYKSQLVAQSPDLSTSHQVYVDKNIVTLQSLGPEQRGYVYIKKGRVELKQTDPFNTLDTTVKFSDPISATTLSFPAKPEGEYTLATLDDITTNTPVSNNTSGIVNNTPLQELGGADKTINGIRIGKGNGTTTENILLGSANTLSLNTTGDYNTAVGYDSMIANTTGNNNSAFGEWALRSNITGSNNTAVGVNALNANKTASFSVAMGASALSKTIDGNNNVAIGASALRNNASGNNNVAIGTNAMFNTIGNLNSNLDGCLCTAVGAAALFSNTTGNAIAVGANSLYNNTTGIYNIGIGDQAGSGITTGSGNTIIAGTGFILKGGGITTGSNNMILAPNSGNTTGITTGSGNVVVGKVTGLLANASNTITISDGVGNIAITKSTIGELKTPNLTQALIISGGTSSLVNKGYVDNTTAVDNATTTTLSSATLTSTYPNALSGFRVRCLNIASGALTYEKTTAGWIQYAITIAQ